MKPVPGVIRMLEEALAAAKSGAAQEAFVMVRIDEEWFADWNVLDTDDLAVQLRTARIQVGQAESHETAH